MKACGHQNGRQIQADRARKKAGQRNADTEKRQGTYSKSLFPENQQHEHGCKREKAGYFAEALQDAYLDAREPGSFDDEIIEQGGPAAECDRHRDRHEDQKSVRVLPGPSLHRGSLGTPATAVKSGGRDPELGRQYFFYQRLVFVDKFFQRMASFFQMRFVHRQRQEEVATLTDEHTFQQHLHVQQWPQ